ncbi:unnamed protein product [Rotaria socialis]|uniref:Uncharacterized protein n=2 Tax=Rotaria socialis TaxID=392032 RepID=A0A818IWI0_9BILA|nr:unnamed protein product [Rotaria socialis]
MMPQYFLMNERVSIKTNLSQPQYLQNGVHKNETYATVAVNQRQPNIQKNKKWTLLTKLSEYIPLSTSCCCGLLLGILICGLILSIVIALWLTSPNNALATQGEYTN